MKDNKILVTLPTGETRWMRFHERVKVNKDVMPHVPPGFRESMLSLRRGARAVYRDGNKKNSLQLRDFRTYWEFELDHFNPEAGFWEFLGHAINDAPGVTTTALLISVGLFGLAKKA